MSDPEPPEYDPPAPGETLQQWLAASSQDWIHAQPTMWLPAVPAGPAASPGARRPSPSIPRQRAPENAGPPRVRPRATAEAAGITGPDRRRAGAGRAFVVVVMAAGLALTPWIGAAAVAVSAAGWSCAVALTQLRHGVPQLRGQQALCLLTLMLAAVTFGMGSLTLLTAFTSTDGPG